ncbi:MAG: BtpA/SgcQ family protein [Treponema sp.]|jgi:membrane complex biogenesis BtpA family protein|nr:BtpA/SgcQ family protein [Treponema sp.]
MKTWLQEMFGVSKPIIAMCHFRALPGDPFYDPEGGMEKVVEAAEKELCSLQEGGVDGIMFSNEFSLPYLTRVKPQTTAAMARIIGELKSKIKIPFGVNVLWDPIASIDLAAATGALFIREIMSGVYASDFGLWNTNAGETARHKNEVGRKDLRLLFNIVPEAARYLADRSIEDIAKTTVFNNHPDALCVSGLTAGVETDAQILAKVKKAAPETIVLSNTGCKIENIESQLAYADGAVVGTTFKIDGKFENSVDKNRVKAFMEKVKTFR